MQPATRCVCAVCPTLGTHICQPKAYGGYIRRDCSSCSRVDLPISIRCVFNCIYTLHPPRRIFGCSNCVHTARAALRKPPAPFSHTGCIHTHRGLVHRGWKSCLHLRSWWRLPFSVAARARAPVPPFLVFAGVFASMAAPPDASSATLSCNGSGQGRRVVGPTCAAIAYPCSRRATPRLTLAPRPAVHHALALALSSYLYSPPRACGRRLHPRRCRGQRPHPRHRPAQATRPRPSPPPFPAA